jgi:hypothetical protein
MTNEQQQIAIAEFCGWKKITFYTQYPKTWGKNPARYDKPVWKLTKRNDLEECGDKSHCAYGWKGSDGDINVSYLPDYLNDLNAMREAEKLLNYYQLSTYEDILVKVVNAGDSVTSWYEDSGCRLEVIRATAAQRAEAFLRTLNLWKI